MYKRHIFEFDPQEDLKKYPVWFLDGSHSVPPWTPMFAWTWLNHLRHGHIYGCGELSIPTTRSSDWREVDLCAYCTATPIEDQQEVEQRRAEFKEKLKPLIDDYDTLWQNVLNEMHGYYDKLKQFNYEKASIYELYKHFNEALFVHNRMWEVHFWWMYAIYGAYWWFEDLCREYVGINDNSPLWHRLIRGFDNDLFESDRRLWRLRNRALELGVADVFRQNEAREVIAELEKREAGQVWLKEFREYLDYWGWRMPRMMEFNCPSWVEDPTPAIGHIQQFLLEGATFELDQIRPRLAKEREEAEKEVLAKVPAGEKDWFVGLMRISQRAGSFSESHDFHFEHICHALFRRACLGCGQRLVQLGVLNEPDDVLFLVPDEVRKILALPENYDFRDFVAARRREWEEAQHKERPGLIGRLGPEEATEFMRRAKDPIIAKITVGEYIPPRPELGADLYGIAGSPGVVEGVARVVMGEGSVGEIRPGDILVSPVTYSGWTPAFALVRGIVTDHGGSLAHAAVVGREYDIPVVINTKEASKKIKTGQKVRVDGNEGVVYILG